MPKAKSVLSTAASLAASAMLIRSICNELLPTDIQDYIYSSLHNLSCHISPQITIVVEEFQGLSINEVFDAANVYLGSMTTTSSAQRFQVMKSEKEKRIGTTLNRNEEIVDVFGDLRLKWKFVCKQVQATKNRNLLQQDNNARLRSEVRHYELSFHRKHKDVVLNLYLPHVLEKAKAIKEENHMVKLHTVEYGCWDANDMVLKHPMNFNTLALDSELKKAIMEDLDNFMNGKEYYTRVGKAWKRGYLLYGPPGTASQA